MKQLTHNRFALLITFLFLVLSFALVLHHEIWMDEAYHYLLPRDSGSFRELIKNASQGGHPLLWNALLFYYQYFFPGVLSTQLLHSAIAVICVFLINRYSPFSRLENVLITFGYFFLYEYNIIAKNYGLGICLIFVALVLYTRKKPLLLIAFVLALAGNTHFFSLFVAIALFIYSTCKRFKTENRMVLLLACFLFGIGILLSCIQVIPSTQHISTYKNLDPAGFFSLDRIGKTLAFMCRGLINIPDFRLDSFWNSNIIFNFNRITCYLLSGGLIVSLLFMFKRDKLILLLFFTPIVLIAAFLYMAPISVGIRYWGYAYVMLIICVWLYMLEYRLEKFPKIVFKFVILVQFLVSIPVMGIVFNRHFSNAKYAALSLQSAHLEKYPLLVQDLGSGPALSAYANKQVYYPQSKIAASFTYVITAKNFAAQDFIAESIHDLKTMHLDTGILVMREPLNSASIKVNKSCEIREIAIHTGALISSEDYYLYLMSLKKEE